MMKKTGILVASIAFLLAVGGCSNNKEQVKLKQQEKKIETLVHEKKELEMLLENEKQKTSVSSSAVDEVSSEESDNSEELESLFDTFVRAQFEQDNEKLKSITTAKLYTMLVDKAGERETNVSYRSTVKSITLYQAEQLNDDEAVLVGKIEVETKVGDFAPNKYQQLVECEAVKDSGGVFQVDSQTLTNLGV